MLVTRCPHCGARFRASAEQLNQRQGQVRCGQCERIFNAFENVVRPPARPEAAAPAATKDAPTAAASIAERPREEGAPQQAGPLPEAPTLDFVAGGGDGAEDADDSAAPPQETPAAPAPAIAVVHQGPARLSRAWSFGVALLLLVLGVQLTYAFRAQIAHRYPQLRPALESVCARAGCRVPWVNDEAALRLEDSEMLEVPGKPGQVALQARIRNLSSAPQEYPHLELTLTDITGQAAIRRVLRPADYLGTSPQADAVMAAGSESLISVRLETGRIRATGYELFLFHP